MNTENKLESYKDLLDLGSFEGLRYEDHSKSRYKSFKMCLEFLSNRENPNILELGTSRSFVDGKYEGCNSDDVKYWDQRDFKKWDWGAGCFTVVFGQLANYENLITLDLISFLQILHSGIYKGLLPSALFSFLVSLTRGRI